jgi:hypothetical protein
MSLPNEIEYERQMSQAIDKLWPEPVLETPTSESRATFVPHCEVCREPSNQCLCRKR